jgi:hypothetical protein
MHSLSNDDHQGPELGAVGGRATPVPKARLAGHARSPRRQLRLPEFTFSICFASLGLILALPACGPSPSEDEDAETNTDPSGGGSEKPNSGRGGNDGRGTPSGGEDGDGDGEATGGDDGRNGGSDGQGGGAPEDPPIVREGAGTCDVTVQGDIPVCCTPADSDQSSTDEVFKLLNAYRKSKGVPELVYDRALERAMQGHVIHMVEGGFFSHNAPVSEIRDPWSRAELCGTRANAENIAAGQRSPDAVMTGWKNSSGHNQNMLNARWKRVGIGFYRNYWGQIFAQ